MKQGGLTLNNEILMNKGYLDNLVKDIRQNLLNVGWLTFSQISDKYDLPLQMIKELLTQSK